MTPHDSVHQMTNAQRTHSSHLTDDHTRCTAAGSVGCVRRRGLYTWQCCGSRCHMSHSGTNLMGVHGLMHPGYSLPAHISPLMGQALAQDLESFHQSHNLQQVLAVKVLTSSPHQLQCMPSKCIFTHQFAYPFWRQNKQNETNVKKQNYKPHWWRHASRSTINSVKKKTGVH